MGRPDGSCQPESDPGWDYFSPRAGFEFGPLPDAMIEKAKAQMDNFCRILENRNVIVDRAVPIDCNQKASTPDWEIEVMHGCMPPRDVLLPVGNEILECTMSIRARWHEYLCYRPILEKYFLEDKNFQWISAPKPRPTDASYQKGYYSNYNNVWTKAEKKKRMLERRWHLTEKEPLFDAADGMRFGQDVIWQASSVSNGLGIDWLKRHFREKGLRMHVAQFTGDYHAWHIDVHLDALSITKNAPNPEAADKWLNWILEPEIGASISNFVQYATPNEASLPYINQADLNNPTIYPSKEVMDKLFYLKDPGENMKLLDQAWTRIKAQRAAFFSESGDTRSPGDCCGKRVVV